MPRRLNRKEYGWSRTYGPGQLTASEEYKVGYDKINWPNKDLTDCPTRQTRFGKARVKVFNDKTLTV